jgi:N-acetylneuraminate synthase
MVQKTIKLARRIAPRFGGNPKVIVPPGAMSLNTKLAKEPLRQALVQSLSDIDGGGIELLLENLPPYPWYFGGQWKGNYFMDAEEIRSFCEETGINICFDLSHAALFCNAKQRELTDFIRILKPFIKHIHFSDAYGLDGEGVQIGEGDIDFDKVMPLFADYQGTWVPEIWRGHLHNAKGFTDALNRLRKYDF